MRKMFGLAAAMTLTTPALALSIAGEDEEGGAPADPTPVEDSEQTSAGQVQETVPSDPEDGDDTPEESSDDEPDTPAAA